jgi:N utilization substance protein A
MEKIQELVAAVEAEMAPAEAVEETADVVPAAEVVAEPVAEAAEVAEAVIETDVEPAAVMEEAVEVAVVVDEPAAEKPAAAVTTEAESPEEEMSFEDLFKMQSEAIVPNRVVDDEEEDEEFGGKGKGKKKKKKQGEIVYDPETDLTVRKKRHKRGEDDWGDW